MTRDPAALGRHPAPAAERLSSWGALVLLFAGPFAWFVQLCVGTWATSWPCFPDENRLTLPRDGYGWTGPAALGLLIVCALVALATAGLAWRKLRQVEHEKDGGRADLAEVGQGRTSFIAMWGILFNIGAAIATLTTLVAFALVPRCLG